MYIREASAMKQFTRQTSGEATVKLRTNIASQPKNCQ